MDPSTNVAPGIGPTPILSGDSSNSSEGTKVEVVAQKAISETKRSSDNCNCFGRVWRVIKIPFSLIYRLFAWIFCCRSKKTPNFDVNQKAEPARNDPSVTPSNFVLQESNPSSANPREQSGIVVHPIRQETVVQNPVVPSGRLVNFTEDSFQRYPDELFSTTLSYLSFTELAKVCRVSKRWKELASDPDLLKTSAYQDIAFGNLQWTLCYNQGLEKEEMLKYEHDAKEFESLPPDIGRLLKSSCPAFPGKRVIETHMLVRLPKGFTLNTLGMLAKKYFPQNPDGYRFYWESIGDRSVRKPTWLLMTKDVLPGSRNRTYAEQQTIVATLARQSHAAYEVPSILEAVACIFAQYFRSSLIGSNGPPTRLFSDNPWTYIRCKDNVDSYQLVVGGFAPSGLSVNINIFDFGNVGVVGLRKF